MYCHYFEYFHLTLLVATKQQLIIWLILALIVVVLMLILQTVGNGIFDKFYLTLLIGFSRTKWPLRRLVSTNQFQKTLYLPSFLSFGNLEPKYLVYCQNLRASHVTYK